MENTSDSLLLSIVIPAYNRQDGLNYLISALSKSIQSSGLIALVEVIVIDDFSNKPITLAECQFATLLERNDFNRGAPFSREKGFQKSRGEFIHFHDTDDSISENWLIEIISELKNIPQIDILMTGRLDVEGNRKIERFQKYFHKQSIHLDKIKSRLVYRNCMGAVRRGYIF